MSVEQIAPGTEAFEAFLGLPATLHAADPRWIPSDPESLRHKLSPDHAFFAYGKAQAFGVRDAEGALAGRCVAILNARIQAPNTPVGMVGYFECTEDYALAAALLDAAVAWLREQGAATVWGPMNFSVWDDYRFMTEGFDTIPYLGEPYNPAYYPAFFERYGFEKLARWRSWDLLDPHLKAIHAAATAVPRAALDQAGFTIRLVSAEDFDEVLPITHAILMEGFSENLGFSPISLEEYRELVEPLRPLIVPGACPILVFDAAGEPAAYGYTYPDLGPQVRAAAGLPTPALDAATNPYRGPRLIMHTMTVRKPYRKMGVPQALMAVDYMPTAFENGFAQAIGAVAKEGRTGYDRTGEHSRAYHLYELR